MGWLSPSKPRRQRRSTARVRLRVPKPPKPVTPTPRCVDCDGLIHRPRGTRGRAPLRCTTCKTSHTPAKYKWTVDPAGLERVRKHFGLKHPLYVQRSSGRHQRGTYQGLKYGFMIAKKLPEQDQFHLIRISSALSPEDASKSILHEACHAKQVEEDPSCLIRASLQIRAHGNPHTTRSGNRAYLNHTTEVEARASEMHATRLKPIMER